MTSEYFYNIAHGMILIKEISQKKRSYKHDENMKLIKASAKLSKNTILKQHVMKFNC